MGPPVDATTLVSRLAGVIGPRATLARGVLEQHGRSESYHRGLPPDVVVFPETTAEVVEIVRHCASLNMPIVPFGAGTSLEGNAAAVDGGVSIDFARMNKVLAVHASDMDVVVQPGITRKAAQCAAARHRLVLSDRSRRRRFDRRHDVDPRLGHDGGALRHHEGQCHGARGRAGRRPGDPHRPARAQIVRRLRSDSAVRRRRGHARRHHRGHAEAASAAGGDLGGGLQLRHPARRGRYRDRDDPARPSRSRASSCSTTS